MQFIVGATSWGAVTYVVWQHLFAASSVAGSLGAQAPHTEVSRHSIARVPSQGPDLPGYVKLEAQNRPCHHALSYRDYRPQKFEVLMFEAE